MRSKLFVPGSRPELFAKALKSQADAISIDLEDAVPEARKDEARRAVAGFLRSAEALESGKLIIVRVNGIGSPHCEADVAAVALPALGMLNLPKAESAADVQALCALLSRAERANGVLRPVPVLANIESAAGLRRAAEIGAADRRVAGLQLGFADLFESNGIARRDAANVHAAMFALRMAAAEAGVFAYDSAFPDIGDAEGFRAEALMSRRLGFWGKSCIHPSQVALANEVFGASEEEFEQALRLLEAARAAQAGRPAFHPPRRSRGGRRPAARPGASRPGSVGRGGRAPAPGRRARTRPERLYCRPLWLHPARRHGRGSGQGRTSRRRQPA
jgi:citrate lyase subunit beta/citryl-CoA lyase